MEPRAFSAQPAFRPSRLAPGPVGDASLP